MICVWICRGYVGALVLMCGAPISIDVGMYVGEVVHVCGYVRDMSHTEEGHLWLMCRAPISIDVCVRTQKRVWICRGSFADV